MDKEEVGTVNIAKKLKKALKKIAVEHDSSIKDLVESAIREKYDL